MKMLILSRGKFSCKGKHNEDISDANFEPNVIMLTGGGKDNKD